MDSVICSVVRSKRYFFFRDLCDAFGKTYGVDLVQGIEQRSTIANLLKEGKTSKNSKTKSLSMWAMKEIKKLKPNA